MGKRGPKATDAGLIYAWACDWFGLFMRLRGGVPENVHSFLETRPKDDGSNTWDWGFTTRKGIPAEPEVLNALLSAQTPIEITAACKTSKRWLDPNTGGGPGSPHPPLPDLADAFLRAKGHPRYPRSGRASSEEKRLWFLAVALAAATWNISLGRAFNLLQEFSLSKPAESRWWKEIMEETGGVMIFSHPEGDYCTDGRQYWRLPGKTDGFRDTNSRHETNRRLSG